MKRFGYTALGWGVWNGIKWYVGAKWYVGRKYGDKPQKIAIALLVAAAIAAVVAIAARQSSQPD